MSDTRVVEVISLETSGISTILFELIKQFSLLWIQQVADFIIMRKWKWLLMNGCTYKTLIGTMLGFFNSCHYGAYLSVWSVFKKYKYLYKNSGRWCCIKKVYLKSLKMLCVFTFLHPTVFMQNLQK
jgi:hypothetical protein